MDRQGWVCWAREGSGTTTSNHVLHALSGAQEHEECGDVGAWAGGQVMGVPES